MEISLFADNCRGQNKSRFTVEMLLLVLLQIQNIESMELFFLECGYTQNENDPIHSIIERNKKGVSIYHPY